MMFKKPNVISEALSPVSADLLRPRNGLSVALICVLVGTLGAGIAWSTQATMVEVSSGQGRVIPSGRIKLVQNLEGGIVQAIHIEEGARVRKGDRLLSIDPIAATAVLADNRSAIRELDAAVQWLSALLHCPHTSVPPSRGGVPTVMGCARGRCCQ